MSLAKETRISSKTGLSKHRVRMLDELERRACLYFFEQAHPSTGLVLDRARTSGREDRTVASVAATGFGLSALCIASQRGYVTPAAARYRAERTLGFLARGAPRPKGFFYHFMDAATGERACHCEASTVDTAWLLCGVIHARQHFDTPAIRELANEIIDQVEWDWIYAAGPTLCHGWTPEGGFLPYRWDRYSELLAMYVLALGSVSHAIPAEAWNAWVRPEIEPAAGELFVQSSAPLFVHQYSHAWLDLRHLRDGPINYFQNSRLATILHREFCLGLRDRFPWFGEEMWGITSSDSRYGYIDWGGSDPAANAKIDGTLVPCAAGGSLVFLPDECMGVLETMIERYGKKVWTRYGFVDAFHPQDNWWSPDVIGIDLGIMLLMAENHRSQSIWTSMMSSPEFERGLAAARFS
jgi:hypothetical protein